jgi:hypothetical protein
LPPLLRGRYGFRPLFLLVCIGKVSSALVAAGGSHDGSGAGASAGFFKSPDGSSTAVCGAAGTSAEFVVVVEGALDEVPGKNSFGRTVKVEEALRPEILGSPVTYA